MPSSRRRALPPGHPAALSAWRARKFPPPWWLRSCVLSCIREQSARCATRKCRAASMGLCRYLAGLGAGGVAPGRAPCCCTAARSVPRASVSRPCTAAQPRCCARARAPGGPVPERDAGRGGARAIAAAPVRRRAGRRARAAALAPRALLAPAALAGVTARGCLARARSSGGQERARLCATRRGWDDCARLVCVNLLIV